MSGIQGRPFDNRQVQLLAVTSTCLALSTVATTFRLLVRWSSAAIFWWDDWVTILALVVSWLVNIFTIVGIKYGLGRHTPQVDPSNVTPFGVSVYVQQINWVLSTGLIILAILLFYIRIFPNSWMHKAVYIIGAWDALWTISSLLGIIFQCTPIEFLWNKQIQGGKCIDSNAFYFAIGLTSAITIVAVLILPLPIIWKLQVSLSKKIGLGISFSVGAFTCGASIVRLVVLLNIDPQDLMYTSSLPQLWSCVEVSFGVVSACLPSLTPLFLMLLGKRPTNTKLSSFSFNKRRDGHMRNAEFNRMAEATDPEARSQSLELIMRNRSGSDETYNLDGTGRGPILVTHEVDQARSKDTNLVPENERVGVVAAASTWNI